LDGYTELGFEIVIIPMAYPSYPPNIVLSGTGTPYVKFHTKVMFDCGTVLDSYAGDWIYKNKYYRSLEDLLDQLPSDVQQKIIFNIDIFRSL
jgi:hypothetical protein